MIKPLPTIFLRVTDIEPSNGYDAGDVICNIFHRNQHVAGVVVDDIDNTFKIKLKTEHEKIQFELRSLMDDERVLGTNTFSYDFIRHADTGKEFFQRVHLPALGDDTLTVKDWGRDTTQTPNIEIGIELEEVNDFNVNNQISRASRTTTKHYNDEISYVGERVPLQSDIRYTSRVEPVELRTTTSKQSKRHFSPSHKFYDTGIRVDGTQQSIVTKSDKRTRSTRHGDRTTDMFNDSVELRGTRPSKFAKVRSSRSIKVNRDTPQHREQLKVVLKRFISQLDNKHDDLVKDTENRLKILDWLFKNKSQYDSLYGASATELSEQETLVSEVDREYADIHKRDQDDLYYLREEVKRLDEELRREEDSLNGSRLRHDELLKFFGKGVTDDLEILEEEIEEDASGRMTSKRLVNRYVRRTDIDIQEIRDENQGIHKELEGVRNEIKFKLLSSQSNGLGSNFDEMFRNIQLKLNGATGSKELSNESLKSLNDEFRKETDKNLNLRKKKIETENEVNTLREFVVNDRELKKRLEEAALKSRKSGPSTGASNARSDTQKTLYNLQRELADLQRSYQSNLDRIKSLENKVEGGNEGLGGLDRLFNRYQNSISQRNDLQSNVIRTVQTNVHTVDVKGAKVGNPADDQRILDLLDKIEAKEKEINTLLDLKEEVDRKRRVSKKKSELSYNLNKDISEIEKRVTELERDSDELKIDAKNNRNLDVELANKDARIQQQEDEIDRLRDQIEELNDRLMREGDEDGSGLDPEDEREIDAMRSELNQINRRLDLAKRTGSSRDLDRKKRTLQEKEEYIQQLMLQMESAPVSSSPPRRSMSPKGDSVDTQLQEYLERLNCEVPVTKLGDGYYLFGTRKIYMKLQNTRLVVRVGGGYMFISEFIETYTDSELNHIEAQMNKESVERYEDLKVFKSHTQDDRKSTGYSPKGFNASMSNRR
jgi:DNA repair exonuclease SbcCD ATPase subunit